MRVPIALPVAPMLARLIDDLPAPDAIQGGFSYEPKWDGIRCIIVRDGDSVELVSRLNKSLSRHFPEVVECVRRVLPEQCVVDSEIILRTGEPGFERLDWDALSARIQHPQHRVGRSSRETPADLVCFDLLSLGDRSLLDEPWTERHGQLEHVLGWTDPASGAHLGATTEDMEIARQWWAGFEGAGLDGVMVKARTWPYEPGRRSMLKLKHRSTAEAVVTGFRPRRSGRGVKSLVLGLHDDGGLLQTVGETRPLSDEQRATLMPLLLPLVSGDESSDASARVSDRGKSPVVAVRPEVVVEVEFDQLHGRTFRHPVQVVRLRPDRDPLTCGLDQLQVTATYNLAGVFAR